MKKESKDKWYDDEKYYDSPLASALLSGGLSAAGSAALTTAANQEANKHALIAALIGGSAGALWGGATTHLDNKEIREHLKNIDKNDPKRAKLVQKLTSLEKKAYMQQSTIAMGTGNTSAGPKQIIGQGQAAATDYTTVPEIPAPETPITTVGQSGQTGQMPGTASPTQMPPMTGTAIYKDLSSSSKKKEINPSNVSKTSRMPANTNMVSKMPKTNSYGAIDMKKNASDYVDAMIRKRAQDGGMLQAYPRVAHGAAQAQLNKLRGVQQPAYKTPTNMQEAEQLIRQLYPARSWPAARAAAQKAFAIKAGANIPTTPVLLAQSQGPTGSAMTSDSAAQGSSTGSAMSAGLPSRVTPTTQQAPVTAPSKPLPVNKPSQPLPVTQSSKPLPTRPASKGLPTKAPSQPLPVTARKNPYKADFAALNRDLKAMSRPAYTPVGPKPANLTVRRGRVPTPPTPTKTTGGIDPATYKGKLQDVVYGDRHYRLPMYEGKTRDFLKANPMWLKQHGEGDKSMGLVKNYKPMRKKAEELVDDLLVKRAACGKSHSSRKKKRSKYAKQYKKNIKKSASEKSGAPENPFDRIDEAIEMMVKEAAVIEKQAYGGGDETFEYDSYLPPYEVAKDPEQLLKFTKAFADSADRQGAKLRFQSERYSEDTMTPEEAIKRIKAYKGDFTEAGFDDVYDLSEEARALPYFYEMDYPTKRQGMLEVLRLKDASPIDWPEGKHPYEAAVAAIALAKKKKAKKKKLKKAAKLADSEALEPVYPYEEGTFTKRFQRQIAPTQRDVKDINTNVSELRKLLEGLQGTAESMDTNLSKFLKTTEDAKKVAADPKVASAAVPGPLAGAIAGGGTGLLLTKLLAEDPTLTKYLTGAGIGTGLGIISSLAAKRYAKDLALNINKSMVASAANRSPA
jgi:hypothetical protein